MTGTIPSRYTHDQVAAWLRGLLAIAWADGHFDDDEKELIASLMATEIIPDTDLDHTQPISPADLRAALGQDDHTAENFMRTAVMVAIADGYYSPVEHTVLQEFCTALGLPTAILEALEAAHCMPAPTEPTPDSPAAAALTPDAEHYLPLLSPVQEWLDHLEIHDPRLARFLCKLIPPQCPFERDIKLFGHKVVHIPPLCKLNPLYEQLVGLRFRALSYLADDCREDISQYC
ncbi:MAG TPA: nitrogenase [Synechococcales cyanobacterium M55_K2018_004]|nr:nitrogenase [Synechococcales cyanobacterium M55_K2018_004]